LYDLVYSINLNDGLVHSILPVHWFMLDATKYKLHVLSTVYGHLIAGITVRWPVAMGRDQLVLMYGQ